MPAVLRTGSVRMLTDGSGNVVARQDYLPFGEEIPAGYAGRSASLLFGASDGVEQKFTGQIRDSETGMDFFPARYYASAVGRFTSPIPRTQVRMRRIRRRGMRMHM